jgi:NTE family protein
LGIDMTRLNPLGAEWRQDLNFGLLNNYSTELRQPLPSDWLFVAPGLRINSKTRLFYKDGQAEDSYQTSALEGWLDLGMSLKSISELRLGWRQGRRWAHRNIGNLGPEDMQDDVKGPLVQFNVDSLDSANFPSMGRLIHISFQDVRQEWGADTRWHLLDASRDQYVRFGFGRLLLGGEFAGTLDSQAPFMQRPSLGGFLRLSGHPPDSIVADNLALVRAVFYRPFTRLPNVVGTWGYLGMAVEGAQAWDCEWRSDGNGPWTSASFLVGFDTVLGSVYVLYGYSPDRPGGMAYLSVGNPF